MALCEVCQDFTFDQFLKLGTIKHRIVGELRTSSKHCILCRLVSETIRRRIAESIKPLEEIEKQYSILEDRRVSLSFRNAEESDGLSDRLFINISGPLLVIDDWHVFGASDTSLSLLREPGTPEIQNTTIAHGRRIEGPSFGSGDLQRVVSTWLDDCNQLHKNCHNSFSTNRILPTRVLDVGATNDSCQLRLLKTHGLSGQYIALSHCWGLNRHIVTNLNNLELHEQRIPYESLPKTFRDAVVITRSLGIRYVWIDSLCIVQDDIQDWKNEAAKMADVYRNAYCTVAATGSRGDQEGILVDRTEQDICTLRYDANDTDLLITYIAEDIFALQQLLFYSPLSQRAWCLQEKLLSPRIIHFTQSRAIWECRTRFETEDLLVLGPDNFGSVLTSSLFSFSTNRSKWLECLEAVAKARGFLQVRNVLGSSDRLSAQMPNTALFTFNKIWYNILHDYSGRGITNGTDKLIALSGVVQEVQEVTGLQYCAGHWLETVAFGLCWTFSNEPTIRVSPYRAPTWSWASVDGRISHLVYHESDFVQRERRSDINLIESQSTMGSDGQMISGVLTLSGQLRQAELIPIGRANSLQMCHVRDEITNGESSSSNIGSVWLDSSPWWEPPSADIKPPSTDNASGGMQDSRQYILLRLTTREWHHDTRDHHIYEILALELVPSSGQYARVGAGFVNKKSWFGDLPLETISLI